MNLSGDLQQVGGVMEEAGLWLTVGFFLCMAYAMGWFLRGWRDSRREKENDGNDTRSDEAT